MDDASRQTLKFKFAKLTMVLNGVFLFAAISILAIAGIIPVYRIPVAVIFGIAAIALAVYFVFAYRRDKAWLASVPDDKPAEDKAEAAATGDAEATEAESVPAGVAEPDAK